MQIQSLTKYAKYIKEKAGLDLIEWDHAFITYSISDEDCFIADLWVDPDYRRTKLAKKLADVVSEIASKEGCKRLKSTLMINSEGSEEAFKAQLYYGFKLYAADQEKLYLVKEL